MLQEDDLAHRVSALEAFLVALLAEHFNTRPNPPAALDAFEVALAESAQLALKGTTEAALQDAPEQAPEVITELVRREAALAESYRIALLNRMRRQLLQDG
jgi:hypothetical protein